MIWERIRRIGPDWLRKRPAREEELAAGVHGEVSSERWRCEERESTIPGVI
jgi:hypothetical protein